MTRKTVVSVVLRLCLSFLMLSLLASGVSPNVGVTILWAFWFVLCMFTATVDTATGLMSRKP